MSKIDDQSLLAMQAARMSEPSIAQTMGWRLTRVQKRLAELNDAAARAAQGVRGLAQALADGEERFTAPKDPAPVADRPIRPGEAMVLRSFQAWGGGHASHVQLSDDRRVLVWIGERRLDPQTRIAVEAMPASAPRSAEYQWRAAGSAAHA